MVSGLKKILQTPVMASRFRRYDFREKLKGGCLIRLPGGEWEALPAARVPLEFCTPPDPCC